MSKSQRRRKPQADSDAEQESVGEEMLLVGGGDELGTYDDSQFQENDEAKKKVKGNNIVRKSHLKA